MLLNPYFIIEIIFAKFSGTFPIVDNFVNNFDFQESNFCPKYRKWP